MMLTTNIKLSWREIRTLIALCDRFASQATEHGEKSLTTSARNKLAIAYDLLEAKARGRRVYE